MKSDVQLNLRAKESQRALIDAAAEILHKSRTDFILEMACGRQRTLFSIAECLILMMNNTLSLSRCLMLRLPKIPLSGSYWQGNHSGICNRTRAANSHSSIGGICQRRNCSR